ncbi:putative holin [Methylomonas sp. BW4-1]|uniref:putative holin n=1 Tax=Methylomonas sp. BW4-1 TaxID=3376685 RepID=UPI0040427DBF
MKLTGPTLWLLAGLLLAVFVLTWLLNPEQAAPTILHFALLFSGGVSGYYLDLLLFPYARPSGYLALGENRLEPRRPKFDDADYPINAGYRRVFIAATLRRAVIVVVCVLAIGLGV